MKVNLLIFSYNVLNFQTKSTKYHILIHYLFHKLQKFRINTILKAFYKLKEYTQFR